MVEGSTDAIFFTLVFGRGSLFGARAAMRKIAVLLIWAFAASASAYQQFPFAGDYSNDFSPFGAPAKPRDDNSAPPHPGLYKPQQRPAFPSYAEFKPANFGYPKYAPETTEAPKYNFPSFDNKYAPTTTVAPKYPAKFNLPEFNSYAKYPVPTTTEAPKYPAKFDFPSFNKFAPETTMAPKFKFPSFDTKFGPPTTTEAPKFPVNFYGRPEFNSFVKYPVPTTTEAPKFPAKIDFPDFNAYKKLPETTTTEEPKYPAKKDFPIYQAPTEKPKFSGSLSSFDDLYSDKVEGLFSNDQFQAPQKPMMNNKPFESKISIKPELGFPPKSNDMFQFGRPFFNDFSFNKGKPTTTTTTTEAPKYGFNYEKPEFDSYYKPTTTTEAPTTKSKYSPIEFGSLFNQPFEKPDFAAKSYYPTTTTTTTTTPAPKYAPKYGLSSAFDKPFRQPDFSFNKRYFEKPTTTTTTTTEAPKPIKMKPTKFSNNFGFNSVFDASLNKPDLFDNGYFKKPTTATTTTTTTTTTPAPKKYASFDFNNAFDGKGKLPELNPYEFKPFRSFPGKEDSKDVFQNFKAPSEESDESHPKVDFALPPKSAKPELFALQQEKKDVFAQFDNAFPNYKEEIGAFGL